MLDVCWEAEEMDGWHWMVLSHCGEVALGIRWLVYYNGMRRYDRGRIGYGNSTS
jgi:hypothetical protein